MEFTQGGGLDSIVIDLGSQSTPTETTVFEYTPLQTPANQSIMSAGSALSTPKSGCEGKKSTIRYCVCIAKEFHKNIFVEVFKKHLILYIYNFEPASTSVPSSPECYTPTRPGMRIVKRKPVADRYNVKGTKYAKLEKILNGEEKKMKSTAELLALTPRKSILRRERLQEASATPRNVNFSDANGLPLVQIQEIPSVKNGQPNDEEDHLEAAERFRMSMEKLNDTDRKPVLIRCHRPNAKFCQTQSQTAIIEQNRIRKYGISTGPIFGTVELEDDPELTRSAAEALKYHKPTNIPFNNITIGSASWRDLPLPGRKQASPPIQQPEEPFLGYQASFAAPEEAAASSSYSMADSNENNKYEQLTEPPVTEYYASTSFVNDTPEVAKPPVQLSNLVSSLSSLSDGTKALLGFLAANKKQNAPAPLNENVEQQQGYIARFDTEPSTSEEPSGYHYVGSFDNSSTQQYSATAPAYPPNYPPPQQSQPQPQPQPQPHQQPNIGVLTAIQHQQELLSKRLPGIIGNQYVQGGWKVNKPCTYFVFKTDGCDRGERCRYLHDQNQKDEILRARQNQQQRRSPPPIWAQKMRSDMVPTAAQPERVGPRGQRVSRFEPVGVPPQQQQQQQPPRAELRKDDRRHFDANRRPERVRGNRRSRFDQSPSSSPTNA
ncbi:unnamed protein product [Caenorhabditis angaria]|uniref:C3H1-type domain-containing protein n=1 Tax=Caenorhabditis angaria TaxID=860376 RepID=A0A9P1J179_9PELO|nr:unnamed protein product [Caenorhabditis angaria]